MTCDYFDFTLLAKDAGISDVDLQRIFDQTLAEYNGDRMMAELRTLRTVTAVAKGACTIEQALTPDPDPSISFRVAEDESEYSVRKQSHLPPEGKQ